MYGLDAPTIVLSFLMSWGIEFTPPLVIRFVLLRRPIGKWAAITICGAFWLINIVLFSMLGSKSNSVGATFVGAIVSYWILRSTRFASTKKERLNPTPLAGQIPDITDATTHLKATDVNTDASVVDTTYEKIDQELNTDSVDRATWIRAQGDSEGNAERTKALYIKYRAQRLLAANRDESVRQSTVDAVSAEKRENRKISRFVADNAGFLVCAVLAIIVVGYYVKQNYAPSLSDSVAYGTPSPQPARAGDTPGNSVDWSQFTPVQPPERRDLRGQGGTLIPGQAINMTDDQARVRDQFLNSALEKFVTGGSDAQIAARFGLTLQEYQRRYKRSSVLCVANGFDDFNCRADVIAGTRQ